MRPYLFKIGDFELRIYALMYIIALLFGMFLAKHDKYSRKWLTLNDSEIEDYSIFALITGLIGARIYYVIFRWNLYANNPISALYVWQGGLAIHGGIIGGMIGVYIYSKYKKQSFFALTDMTVMPLLFGQTLGRIGNFANGEIQGYPVFTPLKVIFFGNFNKWWKMYQSASYAVKAKYHDLVPWGVVFPLGTPAGDEFPNYKLHPAMLYELVLNLIGFCFLWFYLRKKNPPRGIISFTYLILYAVIRSFVSFFRAEDLMFFGMRAPHVISVIMIIVSIIGITVILKKNKNKGEEIE